jgi:hypothetical protein
MSSIEVQGYRSSKVVLQGHSCLTLWYWGSVGYTASTSVHGNMSGTGIYRFRCSLAIQRCRGSTGAHAYWSSTGVHEFRFRTGLYGFGNISGEQEYVNGTGVLQV